MAARFEVTGDRIHSRGVRLEERAARELREAWRWPGGSEERRQGVDRAGRLAVAAERYSFFAEWHVAMAGELRQMAACHREGLDWSPGLSVPFKVRYSGEEIVAIVADRLQRKLSETVSAEPLAAWPADPIATEIQAASRSWRRHQERQELREANDSRLRLANGSMCDCERRQMRFLEIASRFWAARRRSEAALATSQPILADAPFDLVEDDGVAGVVREADNREAEMVGDLLGVAGVPR